MLLLDIDLSSANKVDVLVTGGNLRDDGFADEMNGALNNLGFQKSNVYEARGLHEKQNRLIGGKSISRAATEPIAAACYDPVKQEIWLGNQKLPNYGGYGGKNSDSEKGPIQIDGTILKPSTCIIL